MEHINSSITLPQSGFRKLVNSVANLRELLPAKQCKIIFWPSCIARLRFKFWSCKISRFKLKPFVHSGVDKRIKEENYLTLIERVIFFFFMTMHTLFLETVSTAHFEWFSCPFAVDGLTTDADIVIYQPVYRLCVLSFCFWKFNICRLSHASVFWSHRNG